MSAGMGVGDVIAERTVGFTRADLVRYAAASGDHNPIHLDAAVAQTVGLPGVIAHGMLTMGTAVQPVVDWLAARGSGRITEYGVRFTRMVTVEAEGASEVQIVATVGALDETAGTARIDLTVSFDGQTVLGKAQAKVELGGAAG